MTNRNPRDRLIGLQACAKAVHQANQTPQETARKAAILYDLLCFNAENPTILPTENPSRYREALTEDQLSQIEGFIRENKLDRAKFEQWLAGLCPGVKTAGLAGLGAKSAQRILDHPEACLKAFGAPEAQQ
jgi:hypothetical protein